MVKLKIPFNKKSCSILSNRQVVLSIAIIVLLGFSCFKLKGVRTNELSVVDNQSLCVDKTLKNGF